MNSPHVNKLTPTLLVDRIEPSLALWEALGFTKTTEVSGTDGLAFVILNHGDTQVMYQTLDALTDDVPALKMHPGGSLLFVEVVDLDTVEQALTGHPLFLARRHAPYGAIEIGITEPGGHHLIFAQFANR